VKNRSAAGSVAARHALLETLARVGREHSDATVLFHSTIAGLMGLHPTDYKVLGILERVGPMSAGEIARASGLATASVTDLIDRLERRGFVRRARDAGDRRRVVVEPAADRAAAASKLFAPTRRSLARLFSRYSVRELAVLADFLRRNAERLRVETDRVTNQRTPAVTGDAGLAAAPPSPSAPASARRVPRAARRSGSTARS
jgi:DNA-binding MarR family transcriptional regulator